MKLNCIPAAAILYRLKFLTLKKLKTHNRHVDFQRAFLMPERKSNVIFAHNHVHIISKRLQYSDRVLDSRVDIYGLVRLVGGG